jgi:signal transduction histidine kinase
MRSSDSDGWPVVRPLRGRFVFAALLLTLLLALVLGANVLTTGVYHRSVAEGVLRDYAGFAAAELESRVQAALAQRLFPLISLLGTRVMSPGPARLATPADLAIAADSSVWRALGPGMTVIRIAPGRPLEQSGAALDPVARRILGDSLPARARAVLSPTAYFGVFWLEGRMVAFNAADAGGSSGTVYGFAVPASAVQALMEPALARAPLLPPSLTGGARLDSVVTYRVAAPTGDVVSTSAAAPDSSFTAERELSAMWGGLRVAVALRPSLASRLIIGGLPRSRLPLVAALLGLTALLVVTAGVQLRRERELTRLREEFVAGASHELRTPLAQIRLFTETLRLGRVRNEDERDRSLRIIDQETRRLSHLVENLLAVSRTGRSELRVWPRELDIAALLRDAVEGFAPIAAARGVTVAVEAPERLDGWVDGDAFRQIVLNLLDNAVKYGPAGQAVTVRLAAVQDQVRLEVEDQGPGVPSRERVRIFRRYVRLDRDRGANTTGTGLGLALVRELARLHGGEAAAEAAPGGGARMTVEWPAGREA